MKSWYSLGQLLYSLYEMMYFVNLKNVGFQIKNVLHHKTSFSIISITIIFYSNNCFLFINRSKILKFKMLLVKANEEEDLRKPVTEKI